MDNPVPRRRIALEDRERAPHPVAGRIIALPHPDELTIIHAMLTAARRSLTWVEHTATIPGQYDFRRTSHDCQVLVSGGWLTDDERFWYHVSCSGKESLPSWMRLREVKDLFVGTDRVAMQILPTEAEYVNVAKHALHLWCCLTEDVVPSFGKGGSI